VIGWYLETNIAPNNLIPWGRVYMSVLHLQLAADFFIVLFWLGLTVWPKGSAVALSAFREGVRQPMYWLLTLLCIALLAITPIIPYFTFERMEEQKMVKEIGFAFTMLAPAVFAVLAASMSISEEIEGRTAVTLMSKPVSRREFLLGKFGGILLAALFMTLILGWWLVWIFIFKAWWEPPIGGEPVADPAWTIELSQSLFDTGAPAALCRGILLWVHEASNVLPGLTIGFCQVMVLLAIAVALATRVPMIVNLTVCLFVYFLGHLTPIMTAVSQNRYALVHFVAQLFEHLLPGLDLFDVGTAIVRDVPLDMFDYGMYTLSVSFYAILYTSIALLFGLILFEDRDLA
jgi:ABC-type transport system involved in multi-copper enzyme maturation permease subunit